MFSLDLKRCSEVFDTGLGVGMSGSAPTLLHDNVLNRCCMKLWHLFLQADPTTIVPIRITLSRQPPHKPFFLKVNAIIVSFHGGEKVQWMVVHRNPSPMITLSTTFRCLKKDDHWCFIQFYSGTTFLPTVIMNSYWFTVISF
ncbi:hypothetical protein V6N12_076304 [Hibiscus sabdariffa]|uniref:Uncharacterized protein n=1 Tax=Hibiscus sabdariffa TaxID=183260 RepID=A0ABR2DCD1_9ROSI